VFSSVPPKRSGSLQGMRPLLLAVPVALVLTGCSGSSTPAPVPSPTATTAAPTAVPTTEAPSASPTPSATPTPTPTARPAAADGDVDGDGKPDLISATDTVLTVVLSSTGKAVTAPIHAEAPRAAPVLGSTDVDRDGHAEVFVETAQGASTTFATPYRFDGTALRELQLAGAPARLGIGGSVTHGDGFRCTGGLLLVLSSDSTDGKAYTVRTTTYRLGAQQLVAVRTTTAKANQGSPAVERSYNVDCGSVGDGQ
jgi:hypothetical protein